MYLKILSAKMVAILSRPQCVEDKSAMLWYQLTALTTRVHQVQPAENILEVSDFLVLIIKPIADGNFDTDNMIELKMKHQIFMTMNFIYVSQDFKGN